MAVIRWRNQSSPYRNIDHFRNEIDKLYKDFFGQERSFYTSHAYPPVNLYEDTDNIYLTTELPGVSSHDIDINVEAESIQIAGERKILSEADKGCYHRRERESGNFLKRISLPTRVDTGKVQASMADGILRVTLPKAEETKPKKIQIKLG